MRIINLTRGKRAFIDDEDFALVSKYKWRAIQPRKNTWYALTSVKIAGKKIAILMHRLILNAPKGVLVDHQDFCGLNNQRFNLRLASRRQNSLYRRKRSTWRNNRKTSSKFIGVHFDKWHKAWKCQINVNGKQRWLGYFRSEQEAAKVYDTAARKFNGEFAIFNFGAKCHAKG
jgi:hypothetical protein